MSSALSQSFSSFVSNLQIETNSLNSLAALKNNTSESLGGVQEHLDRTESLLADIEKFLFLETAAVNKLELLLDQTVESQKELLFFASNLPKYLPGNLDASSLKPTISFFTLSELNSITFNSYSITLEEINSVVSLIQDYISHSKSNYSVRGDNLIIPEEKMISFLKMGRATNKYKSIVQLLRQCGRLEAVQVDGKQAYHVCQRSN